MTEAAPFSEALRLATRDGHDKAQNAAFIEALLSGNLSLAGYAALAGQHHVIYSELERAGDAMREDPVAGPFVIDALRRLPALEVDLRHLLGPDWRAHIEPTPATIEYRDRLIDVATTGSAAFVAHHYTRYLGDIAGGQIIRTRLRAQHGITGAGAAFYDFDALGPVPPFRKHYRGLLDDAPWSPAEQSALIDEARLAFDLNTAVLTDLTTNLDQYRVA